MIIHERYCKRCHKITNHRELKKDYYECINCRLRSINTHKIEEENINLNDLSYYLYIDGQYIYFNDILGPNIFLKEDIRKLLKGEILRAPAYRLK